MTKGLGTRQSITDPGSPGYREGQAVAMRRVRVKDVVKIRVTG